MQENHWCKVCGVGYYACNDCDKTGNWRATSCSPHHAQIYSALIFYSRGYSTKEQTASYLKSLGLTQAEISTFTESVQKQLKEILTIDTPKVSRKDKRARG